jgi:hypothetical protein
MMVSTWRKMFLGGFIAAWLMTDALFWIAGLTLWAILWLVILGAVVVAEIIGVATGSHKTISTRLGKVIETKPALGWAIIAAMLASWAFLLLHLAWGR